jgi:hypothetical protein
MTTRQRMTWGARTAGNPPATPGYGTADKDHPAHQEEPKADKYENGTPDSWAETPKKPPYPQGNPPATPGYDVEDQDHPAHVDMPRVPKEANLRKLVEQKAARCVRLARLMLKDKSNVTASDIEDQALELMDLSDSAITASEKRLGGEVPPQFLEQQKGKGDKEEDKGEEKPEEKKNPFAEKPEEKKAKKNEPSDKKATEIADLEKRLAALKAEAGQNADVSHPPFENKPGKSEEQARKPEIPVKEFTSEGSGGKKGKKAGEEEEEKEEEQDEGKKGKKAALAFVAAMSNNAADGFVTAADWKGSKAIFAAADKDKDGIVTAGELADVIACGADMGAPVPAPVAAEEDPAIDESGMFSMTADTLMAGDGAADPVLEEIFGKAATTEDEGKKPGEEEEEGGEGDSEEFFAEGDEEKKAAEKKAAQTPAPAARVASQRPQPRKPSTGVSRVGPQARVAATRETDDLSRLWQTSPDVSKAFGG